MNLNLFLNVLLLLIILIPVLTLPARACTSFAVYSESTIYGSNLDFSISSPARFSIQDEPGFFKHFLVEYQFQGTFRGTMGMNENGILATLQTVPPVNYKPKTDSAVMITDIFDWALNNAERIEDIEEYVKDLEIYPTPGFFLHIHFADKYGKAMILEVTNTGKKVIKRNDDFSVMTNFYNSKYSGGNSQIWGGARYGIATYGIKNNFKEFNPEIAFDILKDVKQYSTRVSLVYLPEQKNLFMALGGNFEMIWHIDMNNNTIETYSGFETSKKYNLSNPGITVNNLISFSDKIKNWGQNILGNILNSNKHT